MMASVLVIACGAIARELVELKRLNNWQHVEFQCLPAELHNRPARRAFTGHRYLLYRNDEKLTLVLMAVDSVYTEVLDPVGHGWISQCPTVSPL